MPADLASGATMLLTVTEPVPMFAEPTGSALIETLLNLQEQETCKA